VIVPQQVSTVSQGWNGHVYPIGVKFDLPRLLPPGWLLLGDIHSHADENAYSSYTDRSDEQYGAGLHVVVGRVLSREPPEFHIEVTADGTRFNISDRSHVFEGYNQRRQQVPRNWIEKVSIVPWESSYRSQKNANTNTYKYRYRKTTAKS
jgi:hypothetical protein